MMSISIMFTKFVVLSNILTNITQSVNTDLYSYLFYAFPVEIFYCFVWILSSACKRVPITYLIMVFHSEKESILDDDFFSRITNLIHFPHSFSAGSMGVNQQNNHITSLLILSTFFVGYMKHSRSSPSGYSYSSTPFFLINYFTKY